MTNNNAPGLIKQYGGRITFIGDIDSGIIDSGLDARDRSQKNRENLPKL